MSDRSAYDSALTARHRADERACRAAERIAHAVAAGRAPAAEDVQDYRRQAVALRYAEAVWQVEADKLAEAS